MKIERDNKIISNNYIQFMIIAGVLGLFLGIMCVLFPSLWVLGILVAVLFLFATLKRPEIALVGILVATSSMIFEDLLPTLSAGGLSLHIPDFLLLGLLGFIVIRWLVDPDFKLLHTPLDFPLIIFFSVTLISTTIALLQSTVDSEFARRMIRILAYYLTFFVVTNLVRNRRQLNFLLNSLFLLASLVAVVMVAQYILGSSVTLLPGRVEVLNTQGVNYNDVTRILPPGLSIVLVVFITLFCVLLMEKQTKFVWLKLIQFGLLGMALLFTFLRSYWGVIIIAFSLLIIVLKRYERQKLLNWGIGLLLLAAMSIIIISNTQNSKVNGLVNASLDRINTLFEPETYQGQDSSLNWRNIENRYAITQIIAHPFLGSGMGSVYRPYDPRLDNPGDDLRTFIHNGHLRILLDSGIVGYFSFIALSVVFLIRGFRYWKSILDDKMKGVVLGFTLVYLAILIAAIVNSIFTQWNWAPVIGIMMGINEVIYLQNYQK